MITSVLAVGARNRCLAVPGIDLDGAFGLRSVTDADTLGVRIKHARHVAVVGPGFIGLAGSSFRPSHATDIMRPSASSVARADRSGTGSLQTLRWREVDSNSRSR